MLFDKKDEKEKNDFFESDITETPKPEPKKPALKPEDPDYWEEEESEWDHLKPRSNFKFWGIGLFAVLLIGLITACYLRFFSPYVDEATQYGYVENIEKRGTIFKTYEGTILPYKELMDTTRLYNRDFIFSVKDEKIAAELRRAQFAGRPVRVSYRQFHATVPWRGSSKIQIIGVDSVDPKKILPPEFRPQ